jgi:hypothetical protein
MTPNNSPDNSSRKEKVSSSKEEEENKLSEKSTLESFSQMSSFLFKKRGWLSSAERNISLFIGRFILFIVVFGALKTGLEVGYYKYYEGKDVPYVTTNQDVVEKMLSGANVTDDDVVYDLGSGDGRIPITAAKKFGARGVGVEIDSSLVVKSRKRAEEKGVSSEVEFRNKDLFDADLSDASVVTTYLFPEIMRKLRPKLLRELDPGDQIVSHDFPMGKWKPDRIVKAGPDKTGKAVLYFWEVPKQVPDSLLKVPDDL